MRLIMEPEFIVGIGNNGKEYLTFNASTIKEGFRPQNATEVSKNICTFLSETINVSRRATGIFSTDLTMRDDLILAFLSLALLLVIEGILTTLLLRTYNGKVSNFSFSIKQFIELAREFKIRRLVRSRRNGMKEVGARKKVNSKLLVIASLILAFTFGVEVLILFLSTPQEVSVTNKVVSFTLVEVVIPDWNEVRKNIRSSTNRPCTAVTLGTFGVDQGENQLSACMAPAGILTSLETFREAKESVDVIIRSDVHEFGAEHEVTIAGEPAKYISRAYFKLGDGTNLLMRKRSSYYNMEESVGLVHKQYVAYLFNYFNSVRSGDTLMTLEKLRALKFSFSTENGPPISIMQVRGRERFRQVTSTRHTTTVKGVIPSGPEALRFAQVVLKGSTAISLVGPDENDMFMGSGNTRPREALMWYESSRTLNWLSLSLLLASAFLVFAGLRWILQPIGTAEIAGAFVTEAVDANLERPPAMLAHDERRFFNLSMVESSSRISGASPETSGGAVRDTTISWRTVSELGSCSGFSDQT